MRKIIICLQRARLDESLVFLSSVLNNLLGNQKLQCGGFLKSVGSV